MTALWPLQQAIYGRLTGDSALAGLASGFDHVPEDEPMPYWVIGEGTENPDDAHDRRGVDATVTLHIWSKYRGYKQALEILSELDRLLDNRAGAAPLDVAGWIHVFLTRESYQTIRDPEPGIRHVPTIYRAWLEEE